uniref:Uncharacterized protein n=1 Tax=Glossina brevipalpis TaxID=37001 RepID=A0A1A9WZX1_9MUSC
MLINKLNIYLSRICHLYQIYFRKFKRFLLYFFKLFLLATKNFKKILFIHEKMDGKEHVSETQRTAIPNIGKQNTRRNLMSVMQTIFGVSNDLEADGVGHEEVFCALSEAKRLQKLEEKKEHPKESDNSEIHPDEGQEMLTKGALRRQSIRDHRAKRKQQSAKMN